MFSQGTSPACGSLLSTNTLPQRDSYMHPDVHCSIVYNSHLHPEATRTQGHFEQSMKPPAGGGGVQQFSSLTFLETF